jgi:hypothetical protein
MLPAAVAGILSISRIDQHREEQPLNDKTLNPPAIVQAASETDQEIVRRIKQTIHRTEKDRWQIADDYVELSNRDWTQQKIADECDVSQAKVSKYMTCARNYPAKSKRPPFEDAYDEVDGKKPSVPTEIKNVVKALAGTELFAANNSEPDEPAEADLDQVADRQAGLDAPPEPTSGTTPRADVRSAPADDDDAAKLKAERLERERQEREAEERETAEWVERFERQRADENPLRTNEYGEPCDRFKTDIPPRVAEVFKKGYWEQNRAKCNAEDVRNFFLSATWNPWLDEKEKVKAAANDLCKMLEAAKPYCAHAACKGKGCKDCRKCGWLTRSAYEELQKQEQAPAGAA